MRLHQRAPDQLRTIRFTHPYTAYAEGSVLVEFGSTKVLCNASVIPEVPRFIKDSHVNQGWVTAEYGMLPRSTQDRMQRESIRGKQENRSIEIQRLIGRALRSCVNLKLLGSYTVILDCDVLQADGGTRTAAINGACVALIKALQTMQHKKWITTDPFLHYVGAISVGIVDGTPLLDLDYSEDSKAQTDMNVVMTEKGEFVELQGTAETAPLKETELFSLLALAKKGIQDIIALQKKAIN